MFSFYHIGLGLCSPAALCGSLVLVIKNVPIPMARFSTDLLSNTTSVAFEATYGLFDLVAGGWALLATLSLLRADTPESFGASGWGDKSIEPVGQLLDVQLGFHIFALALIVHKRPMLGDKEAILQAGVFLFGVLFARLVCLPPIYVSAIMGAQVAGFSAWLQRLSVRLGFTPTNVVGLFLNAFSLLSLALFRVLWVVALLCHSWLHASSVRASLGIFGTLILVHMPFTIIALYYAMWLVLTIKQLKRWYKVGKKGLRFKRIPSKGNLLENLAEENAGGGQRNIEDRENTPCPPDASPASAEWQLVGKHDGYVSEGFDDITLPCAAPARKSKMPEPADKEPKKTK